MATSKLQKIVKQKNTPDVKEVITLLLKDHKAMRDLMDKIKSKKATPLQVQKNFSTLEKIVNSHMKSEEVALLNKIREHDLFEDEANEGYEEHRIHESIISGIKKLKDKDRKITQIKIFCEFLEHHLDEEEEDLFPKFKKYSALSTRKKMGSQFLQKRRATRLSKKKLGALKEN